MHHNHRRRRNSNVLPTPVQTLQPGGILITFVEADLFREGQLKPNTTIAGLPAALTVGPVTQCVAGTTYQVSALIEFHLDGFSRELQIVACTNTPTKETKDDIDTMLKTAT